MDTRRTLEVHSICASIGCIPRWVVRQLTPKYPRGRWDSQAQWRRMTLKIIRWWETEISCMASNTRHKVKWTSILAGRRWVRLVTKILSDANVA